MRYALACLLAVALNGSAQAQSAGPASVADEPSAQDRNPGAAAEPAPDTADPPQPDQPSDDFYCRQRALGRWFYCEKSRNPAHLDAANPDAGPIAGLTASQRVAAISKHMDELRDRAILDPSEANMVAFMKFQRQQSDRASLMADVFERTLIAHPDMDYNLQRPVSALGKQNWLEQRNQEIATTMLQLKQRYGVFFFFASRSRPSAVEAPILRSLADNYGLTVVAVSEDGGPSQEFPDYLVDTGQRRAMGLPGKDVPMIALFDTASHKTVLIATGVVAADDVMQRIFLLTKTEPGKDY